MSISSLDNYIAASHQLLTWTKTTSITTVANTWYSLFDVAGNPSGTLAGTSTTAGVVPTTTTAGFPLINTNTGNYYLTRVDYANTVACRIQVFDCLWKGGAYNFNSSVTLSAQPDYSGRLPGTNYVGLEIWLETTANFTGNQSIAVTYTDQSGNTGHTTGTVATGVAPKKYAMLNLPLSAGDTGLQKIESVVSSVATVGTFNVLVLRPLWTGRVPIANFGDVHGLDRTGMPQIYQTSALYAAVMTDSTASGIPDLLLEVASA